MILIKGKGNVLGSLNVTNMAGFPVQCCGKFCNRETPVQRQCISRLCIKQWLLHQITLELTLLPVFLATIASAAKNHHWNKNLEYPRILFNISFFWEQMQCMHWICKVFGAQKIEFYFYWMGISCWWYVRYGGPAGTISSQSAISGYHPPTQRLQGFTNRLLLYLFGMIHISYY